MVDTFKLKINEDISQWCNKNFTFCVKKSHYFFSVFEYMHISIKNQIEFLKILSSRITLNMNIFYIL